MRLQLSPALLAAFDPGAGGQTLSIPFRFELPSCVAIASICWACLG